MRLVETYRLGNAMIAHTAILAQFAFVRHKGISAIVRNIANKLGRKNKVSVLRFGHIILLDLIYKGLYYCKTGKYIGAGP
jgi:hypothetical protein